MHDMHDGRIGHDAALESVTVQVWVGFASPSADAGELQPESVTQPRGKLKSRRRSDDAAPKLSSLLPQG